MERDDSQFALSLVSIEGVRTIPNENLSPGPESTALCIDEHYYESRSLFDWAILIS